MSRIFRCDAAPHVRLMLESRLYLDPVVEAELMESAELVRVDLTRSLGAGSAFVFWKGLATSLGLHCEPEPRERVMKG